MSNTEHAPEPTMDEILASIRRIIADDGAQQPAQQAPRPAPQAPRASSRGSLTEDIDRAWRGEERETGEDGPADETMADEFMADEFMADELVADELVADDEILDLTEEVHEAPPPPPEPLRRPSPPPPPRAQRAEPRRPDPVWDEALTVPQPPPAPLPDHAEHRQARSMAMSRIAEATGRSADAVRSEPAFAGYREAPLPPRKPGGNALRPVAGLAEALDDGSPPVLSRRKDEGMASSTMSLEDSIREMLRPMLRQWLDDNLPRILESAVRDELAAQVQERQH